MKDFVAILKEFSGKQKLLVLVLLLGFTSGTYMFSTYVKSESNSCSVVLEENKKLLNDLVEVSSLVRRQRIADVESNTGTRIIKEELVEVPQPRHIVEEKEITKIDHSDTLDVISSYPSPRMEMVRYETTPVPKYKKKISVQVIKSSDTRPIKMLDSILSITDKWTNR